MESQDKKKKGSGKVSAKSEWPKMSDHDHDKQDQKNLSYSASFSIIALQQKIIKTLVFHVKDK